MKRTPIAHVIFPRANALRPVPEFAWEAVRAIRDTDDLDVDVLMPVPIAPLRSAMSRARRRRGAAEWPDALEEALLELDPTPTLVPYLPVPRRSTESASLAICTHLLRRPRAGRPRVLHGSFLDEGGFCAAMAGRVLDVPSIVVAHGTDVRAARGTVRGIGRRRRAMSALRKAAQVIAVSNHLANELALLGTRAEVLQYTALAERFEQRPMPRARTKEVLFVGRLSREKGVDLLLEAVARMKTPARLRLVGGEVDVHVEDEARRLGISDRIAMEGELPQDALPGMYQRASCLVLPARSEGLPCVIAEALLVGRPVVATDVGGVRELVDDQTGRLVSSGDVSALAAALDEVLQTRFDPKVLRNRVLPFSWERVGPRLADLTRRLC